DLETLVGALALAGMNLALVVEPAGHVLDIGRHVEVVVHAALTRLRSALRHRAPARARQHLGKAVRALRADAVLAPPVIHLGNVGSARPGFDVPDVPEVGAP